MPPVPLTLLAALLVAALIWPAPAGAGAAAPRWRAPVDGPVVARFTYARAHPFAAGQRRGVAFAAAPGSLAAAPCDGRVVFSGRVPRFGTAVSIRCADGLVATVLELAATSVRRGTSVDAGRRLGTAGPGGRLRLGARRATDGFGYRDPLPLLAPPDPPPRPVLPLRPTLGRAPRGGAPPRRPAPARPRGFVHAPARTPALSPHASHALRGAAAPHAPAPARSPARSLPAASSAGTPTAPAAPGDASLAAWLGAALVATALGAGGTARIARCGRAVRRLRTAPSRAAGGG